MLVPVKNVTGEQLGEIEMSDAVFAAPVNKPLMHQALVRQLANARLGTHDTKGRSEVSGGGRKPWRQKGTGRARQGSIRASQWIGGGTVFGPTPRKYTQSLNKKMQRAALRSALSVKVAAGQFVVLDEVALPEMKTSAMARVLDNLGVAQQNVLLVLAEKNEIIWRSAHNLPKIKTMLSSYLNVRDLLGFDTVLVVKDAVELIELWLGNDAPAHDPVSDVLTDAATDTMVDAEIGAATDAGLDPAATQVEE